MLKFNPMTACDYYKLGHLTMSAKKVEQVVSTWTPRHHKYDEKNRYTVHFGTQYVLKRWFIEAFEDFFKSDFEIYENDFRVVIGSTFNTNYLSNIIAAFKELHEIGYLPITVYSLPEGSLVADGCPVVMMSNTIDGFGWLVQFLEDLWSANSWLASTSATTAYYRRKEALPYFRKTAGNPRTVHSLCGDFSLRGHTSLEAGAVSGMGHLLSFDKTATIDANRFAALYYNAENAGAGTPSLEHSVVETSVSYFMDVLEHYLDTNEDMEEIVDYTSVDRACALGYENRLIAEMMFISHLLVKAQPHGTFTYVADTYDYWGIVGKVLPLIKDLIVRREGKFILRPDSGDPVKVILGNLESNDYWERMGTMDSLALIFGTTMNNKGFRVLESHVGWIYGDAITSGRQEQILKGLVVKNYSAENAIFGIGAYSYQYVTRDTRGFAIKAVSARVKDGFEKPIFKEPKTDPSKKSQKGAVVVTRVAYTCDTDEEKNIDSEWKDGFIFDRAVNDPSQVMEQVFYNGKTIKEVSFTEIRQRLWKGGF